APGANFNAALSKFSTGTASYRQDDEVSIQLRGLNHTRASFPGECFSPKEKCMTRASRIVSLLLLLIVCAGVPAFAQTPAPEPKIDTGDTAWMLTSAALVLFMTIPGLFLFYGGLVRSKNVLGMLMQNFSMVGLITIQWIIIGYSLSFATGSSFLGGLQWVGLNGVGSTPNADYAATIPHQTFMFYQLMFAIITPALMTGAFAERLKFSTFAVFSLVWATLVYDPLAHWVWGVGGFLRNMGALDFA